MSDRVALCISLFYKFSKAIKWYITHPFLHHNPYSPDTHQTLRSLSEERPLLLLPLRKILQKDPHPRTNVQKLFSHISCRTTYSNFLLRHGSLRWSRLRSRLNHFDLVMRNYLMPRVSFWVYLCWIQLSFRRGVFIPSAVCGCLLLLRLHLR